METKDATTGAAIVVLLAILGLVIMIGLILLMMWKQPGIERSPSQQSSLYAPDAVSELSPVLSDRRNSSSAKRMLRSAR